MLIMFKKAVTILLITALFIPQGAYAAEGMAKEELKTPKNTELQESVKDYSTMPISEVEQIVQMGFTGIGGTTKTRDDIGEMGFLLKAAGILISLEMVGAAGIYGVRQASRAIRNNYPSQINKNLKEVLIARNKFSADLIEWPGNMSYGDVSVEKLLKKMRAVERAKIAEEKAVTAAEKAAAAEETKKAISEAKRMISRCERTVTHATNNKLYKKFLSTCSAHLKGKGGTVGAVLVAASAIGVLTMSSVESQASVISNKRLVVENILNDSYKNTPELFAINVFFLKEKFGDNLVSSVLYEKRTKYMPLLEIHLELIKLPVVQELAKELMQQQIAYELSVDLNDLESLNKFGTPKDNTQIPLMN